MTCAPSEDAREPQSYLIQHLRAGGHPADVATRDSGREGRSKREMEVTEAREFETGVVCV